ncbi:hypothetical protein SAMN02745704_02814 [Paucidesulfovibrio gracilis DSM 16080]|uniref:Uncharacterized protein n=1 Tax=Paucidesulfovibrio gracilis DSM 16080 TaxID=1121449 RepID=A0A1T4Y5L1_9BACT|nr:hypothetical protein [Paucidesulfovibrio gracilis]SKA97112.1 hypothetical protein SAMN02745704_02814 [Paucidesulfovibrio gracilis DSM 16080]
MPDCELLDQCGFFKKYKDTKKLACSGFIKQYCKGPLQAQCMRKAYRQEHGKPPSDDMMPPGGMVSA